MEIQLSLTVNRPRAFCCIVLTDSCPYKSLHRKNFALLRETKWLLPAMKFSNACVVTLLSVADTRLTIREVGSLTLSIPAYIPTGKEPHKHVRWILKEMCFIKNPWSPFSLMGVWSMPT